MFFSKSQGRLFLPPCSRIHKKIFKIPPLPYVSHSFSAELKNKLHEFQLLLNCYSTLTQQRTKTTHMLSLLGRAVWWGSKKIEYHLWWSEGSWGIDWKGFQGIPHYPSEALLMARANEADSRRAVCLHPPPTQWTAACAVRKGRQSHTQAQFHKQNEKYIFGTGKTIFFFTKKYALSRPKNK